MRSLSPINLTYLTFPFICLINFFWKKSKLQVLFQSPSLTLFFIFKATKWFFWYLPSRNSPSSFQQRRNFQKIWKNHFSHGKKIRFITFICDLKFAEIYRWKWPRANCLNFTGKIEVNFEASVISGENGAKLKLIDGTLTVV